MRENAENNEERAFLVSVIVCTYNRAEQLKECLATLCVQTLDGSEYEVLVVDNNSTDETGTATKQLAQRYPYLHYIQESRQGLSHARNRGWQLARGAYVAYIDDDCRVPSHWLAVAKEVIELVSPAAFGGPYFGFYRSSKPPWFLGRYVSHIQGKEARPLEQHEYLDGMNMAFRRPLLQKLGGFNPNLGMCGKKVAYGEETDILRRIRATVPNEVIYYEPRLFVHHLVRPEKMTLYWNLRQRFIDGRYSIRAFHGDNSPVRGKSQLLKEAVWTLMAFGIDISFGVLQRDSTRYPYVQNYLYEHTFGYLRTLGKLWEQYLRIVNSSGNRTGGMSLS